MTPAPPPPAELLDLLPVSVVRVGPDYRLRWANKRFCRTLERPPAEVIGHTCLELGASFESWGDWVGAVRSVFATGRPAEVQYVADLPHGERLVLTKCVPVAGPGGVAEVLAVAVDHDEVRQLREALSSSERTFQAFMDHLPGIAWLRDADQRFVFVNREYQRLMRVTQAERAGKHVRDVFPPAVADVLLANDARAAESGQPLRAEERVPDADGVVRPFLNVKFTVPGPDGRLQYAGVGLDMTAERAAEAARRELEGKLLSAQRAEALGVLAGGVAHDFNNILCAVLGYAGLGRELAAGGSPQLLDCFAQIETAAERAADLCRQMLAYAGQGKTEARPVDLAAVVRETLRLLGAGHLRGVSVVDRLADDLPRVAGDVTQLRRVALNLLTNAAEATVGRPERLVTVAADNVTDPPGGLPPGRYVRLSVADNGTGIDPAVVGRIFEPFFTTKFTGRGLGLAAVDGIIRGHRGAVTVATSPGRGSTFTVLLPVGGKGVG